LPYLATYSPLVHSPQQAVYGVTKMIIFAYDKPKDGDMPEVEVLYNMLSYIKDSSWYQVLIGLDQSFDKNTPRNPISIWIHGETSKDSNLVTRSVLDGF
jgi:hypothetical protein